MAGIKQYAAIMTIGALGLVAVLGNAYLANNISGKTVSVFKETLFQLPNQKVWYLRGVRQHIWRRCKKIKGFIPLIGIDIMSLEINLVLYQDGPVMPNLGFIINSFLRSSAHKNLTISVCN